MSKSKVEPPKSRHWSGPGRNAEVKDPKRRSVYLGDEHWAELQKKAAAWGLRGPSAVIRSMVDDFDYS